MQKTGKLVHAFRCYWRQISKVVLCGFLKFKTTFAVQYKLIACGFIVFRKFIKKKPEQLGIFSIRLLRNLQNSFSQARKGFLVQLLRGPPQTFSCILYSKTGLFGMISPVSFCADRICRFFWTCRSIPNSQQGPAGLETKLNQV